MTSIVEEHTVSADGTRIGWERIGQGAPLVVLHGGGLAGKHYRGLGAALADRFSVLLVDRRGRGLSGPAQPSDGIGKEIEDLAAVMKATGANQVFGNSAGAMIALEAARVLPIRRLGLFEPPVSLTTMLPLDWLPAFERALARGQRARAWAIQMKGAQMAPRGMPAWFLRLGCWLMMKQPAGAEMGALLGTVPRDLSMALSLGTDLSHFRDVRCPALLLGGSKSPPFLHEMLGLLKGALPDVRLVVVPGAGHAGPTDMDSPLPVAAQLRTFFDPNGAISSDAPRATGTGG